MRPAHGGGKVNGPVSVRVAASRASVSVTAHPRKSGRVFESPKCWLTAASIATVYTQSIWPDLAIGLAIAAMNADAARDVWQAAREEHQASDQARA
jgi:hypothetical protein